MRILVTGGAGFVGAHTVRSLLDAGHEVTACDSFTEYYSPIMKLLRVRDVIRGDTHVHTLSVDREDLFRAYVEAEQPHLIIHLAAQPGVRLSITDPGPYLRDNITGTWNVLHTAARYDIPVMYASSSSVYGDTVGPLTETQPLNPPRSLYAATKHTAELFAQTLNHTHGLSSRALRLFTVYGPWGRPDMAVLQWANAVLHGDPIVCTATPTQSRDLTYIDDVTTAITLLANRTPTAAETINVGAANPHTLHDVITCIQDTLNTTVPVTWTHQATGDVTHTHADTHRLMQLNVPTPRTPLHEGINATAQWADTNKTHLAAWCRSVR